MIQKDRLVQTFLDLVQIDSPSGEEEAIAKELMVRLKKLGAKVEQDDVGNVIAQFEGEGEPLIINGHMDTVEPGRGVKPKVLDDLITSDGTTILGADCKSGLAGILEALESAIEDKKTMLPIDVVLTVDEESALLGSSNLDMTKIRAKRALVFDAGETPDEICLTAPYYNSLDIDITGRAAHSGGEPEKGISAIQIATEIISKLTLGRIDEETTANVGVINGGQVRNAVPEKTTFIGEIRSRDLKKLEKYTKQWEEAIKVAQEKNPEALIDVKVTRDFDGYKYTESHPLVKLITSAQEKAGLTPKFIDSGGGTDVNHFVTKGITALGVGHAGFDAHTTRESTKIPELIKLASVVEYIITHS